MPDTETDPFQHAAAPATQRIDRDLRTATGVVRAMLRVIRAELFEPGFDVNRIRSALDLRSTKDMAKFRRAVGTPVGRTAAASRGSASTASPSPRRSSPGSAGSCRGGTPTC